MPLQVGIALQVVIAAAFVLGCVAWVYYVLRLVR